VASDAPSSATALFGAEVHQLKPLAIELPLSLQEKAA
jgi:hypothetical protein